MKELQSLMVPLVLIVLVIIVARAERPGVTLRNIAIVGAFTFILYTAIHAGIIPKAGG